MDAAARASKRASADSCSEDELVSTMTAVSTINTSDDSEDHSGGIRSDAQRAAQRAAALVPAKSKALTYTDFMENIYVVLDDPSSGKSAKQAALFVMVFIIVSSIAFVFETMPSFQ